MPKVSDWFKQILNEAADGLKKLKDEGPEKTEKFLSEAFAKGKVTLGSVDRFARDMVKHLKQLPDMDLEEEVKKIGSELQEKLKELGVDIESPPAKPKRKAAKRKPTTTKKKAAKKKPRFVMTEDRWKQLNSDIKKKSHGTYSTFYNLCKVVYVNNKQSAAAVQKILRGYGWRLSETQIRNRMRDKHNIEIRKPLEGVRLANLQKSAKAKVKHSARKLNLAKGFAPYKVNEALLAKGLPDIIQFSINELKAGLDPAAIIDKLEKKTGVRLSSVDSFRGVLRAHGVDVRKQKVLARKRKKARRILK